MTVVERFEWHGDNLKREVRAAAAAAAVRLATQAAEYAKELAPVGDPAIEDDDHPGALKRSITVSLPGETHAGDYDRAVAGEDLLDTDLATLDVAAVVQQARIAGRFASGTVIKLEMGSWLPYACVQEVRTPFIYPGVELMRPEALDLVVETFRERLG